VADDLAADLGDQRQPTVAAVAQGLDDPGLLILPEGDSVDVTDGLVVGGGFKSDRRLERSYYGLENQIELRGACPT
jgi:hypothetical protein